jgi:hypothetical protein
VWNVQELGHDVLGEEGSISSPKRCVIVSKCNIIKPSPNELWGILPKVRGFLPSE